MDGWMHGWVGGWVGEWMDGWTDGWIGGWMGGSIDFVGICARICGNMPILNVLYARRE